MIKRSTSVLAVCASVAAISASVLFAPVPVFAQSPTPTAVEMPPEENKSEETPQGSTETEILASQGATFAAKDRIAVFMGDVRVKDPRFQLAADKLTVFLAKEAAKPAASPVPAASATPAPLTPTLAPTPKQKGAATTDDDTRSTGGIDHAVAEGHVIIIQKRAPTKAGEEEKVSIGRSETAEFDNKTGDLTLRGWPKVEQNGNIHEALSHSTVMILHRDNSLDTKGPSRTRLIQKPKDDSTPGVRPSGSPVATRRNP